VPHDPALFFFSPDPIDVFHHGFPLSSTHLTPSLTMRAVRWGNLWVEQVGWFRLSRLTKSNIVRLLLWSCPTIQCCAAAVTTKHVKGD